MGHVDGIVMMTLEGEKKPSDYSTFDSTVGLHWLLELEVVADACGLGMTKIWRWRPGFQTRRVLIKAPECSE